MRTLTERQGTQIGCPEEAAWQQGWIDGTQLVERADLFRKTSYVTYLKQLAE